MRNLICAITHDGQEAEKPNEKKGRWKKGEKGFRTKSNVQEIKEWFDQNVVKQGLAMIYCESRPNGDVDEWDVVQTPINEVDLCKGYFKNRTMIVMEKIKYEKDPISHMLEN